MSDEGLTQEELRRCLLYDSETGLFRWRVGRRTGQEAGYISPNGYRLIQLHGRLYSGHRLAHLYVSGEWPRSLIDHIDRVRSNNSWANLRSATYSQNGANRLTAKNSKSGVKGVFWNRERSKWRAVIVADGVQRFLGHFTDLNEASNAYDKAATEYYRGFALTNMQMEANCDRR